MNEARALQDRRLNQHRNQMPIESLSKTFAKHMMEGNIHAALRLLEDAPPAGVIEMNDASLSELKRMHPSGKNTNEQVMLTGALPKVEPISFESIDNTVVMRAALTTRGSSGPSGLDSDGWRRVLASKYFGSAGNDLRTSIAKMTKILCREIVDLNSEARDLEAYLACRLIPLDKSPGVRPIGIGEVLRRIVGKAIISVIRPDIINSAGFLQLCAGQKVGCEAAVHAMNSLF